MLKSKHRSAIALVVSGMALSGCWWDSSDDKIRATEDLTAAVNSSTVASVSSKEFSFTAGVSAFGTTAPTTVNFKTGSTFEVTSSGFKASGDTTYGSCIFSVTSSTYPASSLLATGQTVTIDTCKFTVKIAGLEASSAQQNAQVELLLGTQSSSPIPATVIVDTTGKVTVNGTTVGTVPISGATGTTGGGS